MSVRDRDWLGVDHLRVVGPLSDVTVDAVRARLVAIHARDPGHPVVCRVDRVAHRWVPVSRADFAAAVLDDVSVLPDDAGTPPAGAEADAGTPPAAAALRRALGAHVLTDRAVRVVLHQGYVGIKVPHSVGDGRVFNTVVLELLGGAGPGPARPTRLPLARGSLAFFGRDPRRVPAVLRVPRPVLPVPSADAPSRPWQPDPVSLHTRSDEQLLPRLRAWRDAHAPGVSAAAVLFAATRAAFEAVGLVPDHQGLMILVDARRYLSKSATVWGNFSAAQYIEPTDPRDPRAVHDAMTAAITAGRPLTTLAIRDVHAMRSGGRPAPVPDRVRLAPAPQLTLTHIGRQDALGRLEWACPPPERVFMSMPTSAGTEGVTVTFAELDGRVHLNVTYHRSTFAGPEIRGAAELICADPVALLGAPAGQPAQ